MWVPFETFFQLEDGRIIEDHEIIEIIKGVNAQLREALAQEVPSKKSNKFPLINAISSFRVYGKYGLGLPRFFMMLRYLRRDACLG